MRKPLLLLLGAVAQLSCSTSESTVPCGASEPSGYQARTTPSFRRDIQPTFAVSCALSTTCHGTDRGAAPQNSPLLGPKANVPIDAPMLSAVMADLLQPALKAPGLARVKPGRPQDSFLLHKLEGSQACAGVDCPGGCGGRMPPVGDPLPREKVDQIRDWILQGAENN